MTDSQLSRQQRKRAEKISQLERVAARMFAERGFEAVGYEDIGANLDLRGPSLYHYFSSKEELFLACVRQSAREVASRLHAICEAGSEPMDTLRALFEEQIIIELRDYPEYVPLFFKLYVPSEEIQKEILNLRRAQAEIFENAVRSAFGIAPGQRIVHQRVALEVAFGALAYLPEWYRSDGELSVDEIAKTMGESLVAQFMQLRRG
jgi:AcrR family transcriptional regulator